MAEEKVEKVIKPKEKYILKQIVTQTDTAIGLNDESEEVFTEKGLLVEILNKLDKIERAVA